eukprot:Phypoly_transcript_20010.p1 GENE.Phypoly_transcript_20010~~Phypoly_transcript_20010.p1  ORF type:complete len:229 (-),score=28.42 Phypoly_transcript_20010:12-659(-)
MDLQENTAYMNALHTMFLTGIHADLILVASLHTPSQEKKFPVHMFVLHAFNPKFLDHCTKLLNSDISASISKLNLSENNSSPTHNNLPRAYLNDIGTESLSLFLENLYTSAIRHPNDYTKEQWKAYEEYRIMFPVQFPTTHPEAKTTPQIGYEKFRNSYVPASKSSLATSATSSAASSLGLWIDKKKLQLEMEINSPIFSDISFLLDDGQRIYAH